MKVRIRNIGVMICAVMGAACTIMGTGSGSTNAGTDHVTFSWKSSNDVSGSISATLADGKTYAGRFFQITRDTTVDDLGPLWVGWGPGWRLGGWDDWDSGPEFITHYSGHVVANLSASDGAHMRCRFQLIHPSEGMAGGGAGECQTPDGHSINAQFPKA